MAEPSKGDLVDGYYFKGGDPSDKNSWVKAPEEGAIADGFRYKGGAPFESSSWEDVNTSIKKSKEEETFKPIANLSKGPSLKQSNMRLKLPDIPLNVMKMEPQKAEELFNLYIENGKDPGYKIVNGFDDEGNPKKIIRLKSYMKGDSLPNDKDQRATYLRHQKQVHDYMEEKRKSVVQDSTGLFDQFIEGLVTPTAELAAGAAEIAGVDNAIGALEEYKKENIIPYDDLSAAQKTAYLSGTALGYVSPGTLINMGAKGLTKIALTSTGKRSLITGAQKSMLKNIGKAVAKDPTTTKILAGKYAGKFVKNAPLLASEGALWEGIASGGDLERAVEGAVMFSVAGPLASMAGEGLSKVGPKILPKKSKKTIKGEGELSEYEALSKAVADEEAKSPSSVLSILGKPPKMEDPFELKVRAVKMSALSASHEAKKEALEVSLYKKYMKRQRKLDSIAKRKALAIKQREDLVKRISKDKTVEFSHERPKSFNDLKNSFHTKATLEDEVGSLSNLQKISSEEGISILDVLNRTSLNNRQAYSVYKQITSPDLVVKRLTPTGKYQIKLKDNAYNKLNKQISKFERFEEKLSGSVNQIKSHPSFNPKASELYSYKNKDISLSELTNQKFRYKVEKMGVDTKFFKFPKGHTFLNQTEKWSRIEEQTGIPVGQIVLSLIERTYFKSHLLKESEQFGIASSLKKLKKLGADGEDLWEWLHYVRRGANGAPVWDTSASKIAPEFKGKEPIQEVKDILFKFREALDWGHNKIIESGQNVGYLDGYVASKTKVPFGKGTAFVKQKKLNTASLLEKRRLPKDVGGEKDLRITDLYELMPRMMNDSVNAASFSGTINEINSSLFMLSASGRTNAAKELLTYTSRALGKNSNVDTIEYLAFESIRDNPEWLKYLTELHGKQAPGFTEDVVRATYDMMYHSFIGQGTNILKKQLFQPEAVASAEIGVLNVAKGKAMAYGLGSLSKKSRMKSKEILNRVKDRLYPEDIDFELISPVHRPWLKLLTSGINLTGKPGMKVFTWLDKKNRETVFFGARSQINKAFKKGTDEVKKIMEDLLPAERTRVIEAFNKYGKEEAMDIYGLMRSKRANYAYSMAEKSTIMSSELGQYVPLMHWTANQWMRHIENIRGKQYKTLAKRVGYAYAMTIAAQYLFNTKFYPNTLKIPGGGELDISGFMPQSSLLGISELSPTTAAKGLYTGEAIAPYRLYKKMNRKNFNYPFTEMVEKRPKDIGDVFTYKPKGKKKK